MNWLAIAFTALAMMIAGPAIAEKTIHARLEVEQSRLMVGTRDTEDAFILRLALSKPVPYRVFFLDHPRRLIVDFQQVDFGDAEPGDLPGAHLVPAIRWGGFRRGWSRMVVELARPYALRTARQDTGSDPALIELVLEPVAAGDFVTSGDAMASLWDLPLSAMPPPGRLPMDRFRVTIDPGHGGIDSGAEVDGIKESDLMMTFAHELSEALVHAGIEATLTRRSDVFVPLEFRMTEARAAAADLLISLHADALPAGQAAGASIYIWDPNSDDRAARQLAARHDRADLLYGINLEGADDHIAATLMDLARADTQPGSEAFARSLSGELTRAGLDLHRQPVKGAAFSVLKSPDIPSVLVELGFLTDDRDRANLTNPLWRERLAKAIVQAVTLWGQDQAARARLLRQ